jgi:hypothetical protein
MAAIFIILFLPLFNVNGLKKLPEREKRNRYHYLTRGIGYPGSCPQQRPGSEQLPGLLQQLCSSGALLPVAILGTDINFLKFRLLQLLQTSELT